MLEQGPMAVKDKVPQGVAYLGGRNTMQRLRRSPKVPPAGTDRGPHSTQSSPYRILHLKRGRGGPQGTQSSLTTHAYGRNL